MRLLPVMDVFKHAIKSTLNNLSFAFYVSWPWMTIILPSNIAFENYSKQNLDQQSLPGPTQLSELQSPFADVTPTDAVLAFCILLLNLLAFASIAVNWHRYILRDEMPTFRQLLRMDSTVWRYVLNSIAIVLGVSLLVMLFVFVIVFIIAFILVGFLGVAESALNGPATILVMFLVALVTTFAMVFIYRLSVKLPSVALERNGFTFGDALKATEGNAWRFVGLGLLIGVLVILVGLPLGFIDYFLTLLFGAVGFLISQLIDIAVQWMFAIFGITILTSLYGYFVENRNF